MRKQKQKYVLQAAFSYKKYCKIINGITYKQVCQWSINLSDYLWW